MHLMTRGRDDVRRRKRVNLSKFWRVKQRNQLKSTMTMMVLKNRVRIPSEASDDLKN